MVTGAKAAEAARTILDKNVLLPAGLVGALLIGAYALGEQRSGDAAAIRHMGQNVEAIKRTMEDSGLTALPDRLAAIEADIGQMKADAFTHKDAQILRYQIREQGIPVPMPTDEDR